MIELLKSFIIGIVEGITEFLPISSTGHIIIADSLMGIPGGAVWTKAFTHMYEYVIQLGAIMAVLQLYFNKLNPFAPSKTQVEKNQTWRLWSKVIVGVLPSAIIGLALNDYMGDNVWVVATMLILYGFLFIIIENYLSDKQPWLTDLNAMSYKMALFIGFFQVLAIIPGTSRSGATILGALLLGASRFVATEFSFFMSIPMMFGIAILKLGSYFLKGGSFTMIQSGVLFVGFMVSWVVAYIAIKFLLDYVKKNDFKAFGYYRIAVGILVIALILVGVIKA
ncbi:Undecaprenyl-diphosphatase [Weissella viridescens]|uniref:Undecaprenyl-diphosphatase n=1 Tax=Weissella viridescens TaxID=1629 RepID=A0A0R2GYB6_WEIVI|nr:undecaprenyl-diphosphate phosphatase [Weissella viridescens]KRN45753.1 undecaprenyl pyrophosphate phosphatase [Weissella viridescens]MBX4173472.1 undecaprenyl-diphosphate phosphatase [Weissella viridescens]GEA95359.1 undecaprenyl-diphosphatase [Weissella viridescens]SOB44183.1 Undecaprenyl-diphosphatase [Weissella viridescens]